jgi:hypothetical protein
MSYTQYEEGKIYENKNFKIFIEKLTYIPLKEALEDYEGENENDLVLYECIFSVSDDKYKFTTNAYHIDYDADMYCIRVYDTTDDETCDIYNEVQASYFDSCGGHEISEELIICDITRKRREDVERVILDVLYGTNGLVIGF